MTKRDLIIAVEKRSGVDKAVIEKVLNSALNEVKQSVVSGNTIYVRGFGTLGPQVRKQKVGQDIRLGQSVIIPEMRIPKFKPSQIFRSEVNVGRILRANEY